MSLRLRSSGGGSVTLQEPVTSIDSTINLPSANATFLASPLASAALTTPAVAGAVEYDGKVFYTTPQETQRGVIPGMQVFRLDTPLVGANATGNQNIIGVGCTLSNSTVYAFDAVMLLSKSAGTTSHTLSLLFGGTATLNNINYWVYEGDNATNFTTNMSLAGTNIFGSNTAGAVQIMGARTTAALFVAIKFNGMVSINAGGTFIPQYSLSAAPGGAYTTAAGSYMSIWPVGTAGSNTSVGTWA